MSNRNIAFSLIELSMALIIISLIIVTILIGQKFIKSAEARSIIHQITQYNSAVQTFKLKYSALPGDFNAASSSMPSSGFKVLPSSGVQNGDGNGLIGTTDENWSQENVLVWNHLSVVNMIETGGSIYGFYWGHFNGGSTNDGVVPSGNIPLLKNGKGGLTLYATSDGYNSYYLGIDKDNAVTYTGSAFSYKDVFTAGIAYYIDSKIDDGAPSKGLINAVIGLNMLSSTGGGTCSVSDALYNMSDSSSIICQLRIRAPF